MTYPSGISEELWEDIITEDESHQYAASSTETTASLSLDGVQFDGLFEGGQADIFS